jgi:hypothetical protein
MKKYTVLNIVFKVISLAFLAYFLVRSIIHIPENIDTIKFYNQFIEKNKPINLETCQSVISSAQKGIINMLIECFCSITLFCFVWFKDLQIVSSSLIKTIKDHSNANKEKKTQEKIEKLQAQQAQINDKINELKDGK